MKRQQFTLVIALGIIISITFITSSCEKEDYDRKTVFPLTSSGYFITSDTLVFSSGIMDFNKNDYFNVDSIFFAVSGIETTSQQNGSDILKTISVELIDLTNNVSIENSKIISDDLSTSESIYSENLIDNFPASTIHLGIRIIHDYHSTRFKLNAANLILVRY